jgi:adenylate cyclase
MSSTSATLAPPVAKRQQQAHDLVSTHLDRAFHDEELAGLRLATRALLIALVVIAGWLFVWVSPPRLYFLEAILALFALCALVDRRVRSLEPPPVWWPYAVIAVNFALLTFSMVGYDLLFSDISPPQMMLRNGTVVYFFVFIAVVALSYSPQLVIWAGIGGAFSWSIGVYLIVRRPETVTALDHPAGASFDQFLAQHLDPHFVDIDVWTQDVLVMLIVAGILAAGVWRSRQLVVRQAVAARERANLARYFSPRIVDALAQADQPLNTVRHQPVAVLFADVVGFTRLSEQQAPEEVIALLRDLHGRLEAAVFEHEGTLDKYLGDGVMATFGTPTAGPRDAANALACGRAMLASVAAWNRARTSAGAAPVRLSVGIHHGDVVLGDIGSSSL